MSGEKDLLALLNEAMVGANEETAAVSRERAQDVYDKYQHLYKNSAHLWVSKVLKNVVDVVARSSGEGLAVEIERARTQAKRIEHVTFKKENVVVLELSRSETTGGVIGVRAAARGCGCLFHAAKPFSEGLFSRESSIGRIEPSCAEASFFGYVVNALNIDLSADPIRNPKPYVPMRDRLKL